MRQYLRRTTDHNRLAVRLLTWFADVAAPATNALSLCTQSRLTAMQTTKVGIREFRKNLADYLESKTPVAITRHGTTIGIYVPTMPRPGRSGSAASGR